MSGTEDTRTGAVHVPPQATSPEGSTGSTAPRASSQHRAAAPPETTAWTGWIAFGAIMLIMMGTFQAIAGLVALFDDGYYVVTKDQLLVNVDYNAWGWVHLAIGAIAIATAVGLLAGSMWARIVGIGIAVVSAVVNLAFLAAYPVWALTLITLDVVVIYAIAVHGAEMKNVDA